MRDERPKFISILEQVFAKGFDRIKYKYSFYQKIILFLIGYIRPQNNLRILFFSNVFKPYERARQVGYKNCCIRSLTLTYD